MEELEHIACYGGGDNMALGKQLLAASQREQRLVEALDSTLRSLQTVLEEIGGHRRKRGVIAMAIDLQVAKLLPLPSQCGNPLPKGRRMRKWLTGTWLAEGQ